MKQSGRRLSTAVLRTCSRTSPSTSYLFHYYCIRNSSTQTVSNDPDFSITQFVSCWEYVSPTGRQRLWGETWEINQTKYRVENSNIKNIRARVVDQAFFILLFATEEANPSYSWVLCKADMERTRLGPFLLNSQMSIVYFVISMSYITNTTVLKKKFISS